MTRAAREQEPLLAAIVIAATIAAYWGVWDHGFVNADDPYYVYENGRVLGGLTVSGVAWAFSTTAASNWHPLTWLSLMLDATVGGTHPSIYHLTNLVLHVLAALLLGRALARMTGALTESAFVALLFAVHPSHVESVAWIAERKDTLSAVFCFLTILAYARHVARPSGARYALVVSLFALGLMAKPMLVTLPLLLLLLDYWPLDRLTHTPGAWRRCLLEKLPLLLLSVVSIAITLVAQRAALRSIELYPLGLRVANALTSCVAYIGQMLWPTHLAFFYPYPHEIPLWTTVLAGLSIVVATVGAVLARHRLPWLFMGWLSYLVMLSPVIGLVQVGSQARADRYTYLPFVGLFVAIAWTLMLARGRLRPAVLVAEALIVVMLVLLTRVQLRHWRSGVELFEHTLSVTGDNAAAHDGLATALSERGEVTRAVEELRAALRIAPQFANAHFNLVRGLLIEKHLEEAKHLVDEEQRLWPQDARTHVNLGLFAMLDGDSAAAATHLERALALEPDSVDAHLNLGAIRASDGHLDEAIRHFRAALEVNPNDADARRALRQAEARRSTP